MTAPLPDLTALGLRATERLREAGCTCPEPGCLFCAPADVYWPAFRAALRTMMSSGRSEWLAAERARRVDIDDRTRARRREYARRNYTPVCGSKRIAV
jgi:hypothetical protein